MKRCVVVGGASIGNKELIRSFLKNDDYYIFCDCGLRHSDALGVKPDLTVGDFDSYEKPEHTDNVIVLPCEKDDTDTYFAVKEGIRLGFEEFLLVGVIGQRFDHTFGNISILLYLEEQGLHGKIIDDFSEIEVVSSKAEIPGDTFSYFSLLAFGEGANGVTVKNAKYELDHAHISPAYQYGISNETISSKDAQIFLESGKMIVVKVF